MNYENRYYKRARIPETVFCELVQYFARDLSATEAARLSGVTRKSVTNIFLKLRRRIARDSERPGVFSRDPNESCTQCICGKCHAHGSRKPPIFVVTTHKGRVLSKTVPDCRKPILRAMIRGRVAASDVPVNGWHSYDALVDAEYSRPFLIKHEGHDAGAAAPLASRIEIFCGFARRRLKKFNGVPHRTFYLHLKEGEWRFNLDGKDVYSELLNSLERSPL